MNRLTRCYFVACVALMCFLTGCGPEPKAPEPAVNPHPHKFTKLKITVEPGAGVTGVRVHSSWVVTNLGCAPHMGWPSGASITKQVDVEERVDKINDDDYVATVVSDRFLPGSCRWKGNGYGIDFFHGTAVLSTLATELDEIEQAGVLKLTCTFSEPHDWPPVCFMRDREAFLRARGAHVFDATAEITE